MTSASTGTQSRRFSASAVYQGHHPWSVAKLGSIRRAWISSPGRSRNARGPSWFNRQSISNWRQGRPSHCPPQWFVDSQESHSCDRFPVTVVPSMGTGIEENQRRTTCSNMGTMAPDRRPENGLHFGATSQAEGRLRFGSCKKLRCCPVKARSCVKWAAGRTGGSQHVGRRFRRQAGGRATATGWVRKAVAASGAARSSTAPDKPRSTTSRCTAGGSFP